MEQNKTLTTDEELEVVVAVCRDLFAKKARDYGASWRIMRPTTVTDQIYIKANRIRTLQINGESAVGEGILPEFIGIVNYGIMGLIQLELGFSETSDLTAERVTALYDKYMAATLSLLRRKNHDYDEAWRLMRVSSYVDLILMKVNRTKSIEDHGGKTLVSEGVDANYMDMINYSLFALVKLYCEGAED